MEREKGGFYELIVPEEVFPLFPHGGRNLSIRSIEDEAIELGGNAAVGVDITHEVLGAHNDMVMMLVGARGTALVVE